MPASQILKTLRTLLVLGPLIATVSGQQPGLDSAPPVAPFLNGVFPSQTPQATGDWELVEAFPNLTIVNPLQMLPVPGSNRLMVAEKSGRLIVFQNEANTAQKTILLDIGDQVGDSGDSGMLGFAFHPEFGQPGSPNNEYLYIYYRYTPDTSENDKAYCRLSRVTWNPASNSINPSTELVMINQYDRHNWHNGGGILFGNDGFLYLSIGDEGAANDFYDSGQKTDVGLLSGVFRIDVDQRGGAISHPIRRQPQNPDNPPSGWPDSYSQGYYIPNDNPWLDPNGSVLEEFWALGTRSPHRMTIDRSTGDIYLGDVGQNSREEVSLVVEGANLQWPYREGSISGPKSKPSPLTGFDQPPLYDYPRSEGSCVCGGYVYHGQTHALSLAGKYIFGDYSSGKIWAMSRDEGNVTVELLVTLQSTHSQSGLVGFGLDANEEIYVLSLYGPDQDDGGLYKLVRTGSGTEEPPLTLSQTAAFSNLATLTPSPGLIPYRVNAALWSDGADKQRWMAIPNDGNPDQLSEQIVYSETGNWEFPEGTVLVKQFTLGNRRLETRFLVLGDDGNWYGVTYRWRNDQSDADLLFTREAETFDIGGEIYEWRFPSRADCMRCHTGSMGRVLGLRTRQLNGDQFYPTTGRTANQLLTLNRLGFLTPSIDESAIPNLLTSVAIDDEQASGELRARSYLDSNCAHCHNPAEEIRNFDLRLSTPLNLSGVINAPVQNNFGITGAREIVPGDPARSMLWVRQNTTVEAMKMPPLGRHRIDTEAVSVLHDWIQSLEPGGGPAMANLVAHVAFEEGSGTSAADSSGNGNNAQLIPNASWVTGHFGSGVVTDGQDGLVRIDHSPSIHLGGNDEDFTVAMWVNLQEGFTGSWRGLAGKGESWNKRGFALFMRPTSNRINYSVSTTSARESGNSSGLLPVGQWTHVALVRQSSLLSLYLGGQFDSSFTLSAPLPGNTEDLFLGRAAGSADPVPAQFDNLLIYNRALDAGEIQAARDWDGSGGTPPPVNTPPTVDDQLFSVEESSVNGTVVGTIQASDPDTGAEGTLAFSVTGGSGAAVFAVDPAGGVITVTNSAQVTAANAPFALNITVADGGSPSLEDSAVVTINVLSSGGGPDLPAGLTAWLPFEDQIGTTATDASGNGHDGELLDGAAWIAGRNGGGGIETDGTSLLRIEHTPEINLGGNDEDFTVAMWVNLQEGFTGGWRGLAGKGESWNKRGFALFMRPNTNRINYSVSTTNARESGSSSGLLPVGQWTHIALVRQGSLLSLYLGGQFDSSFTLTAPLPGNTEDLFLGRAPGSAAPIPARFDSLQVYNRALTGAEILQSRDIDDTTGTAGDTSSGQITAFSFSRLLAASDPDTIDTPDTDEANPPPVDSKTGSSSVFSINQVMLEGGSITIDWPSQVGITYDVQFSNDARDWHTVSSVIGERIRTEYSEKLPQSSRGYYRVRIQR